MKYFIYTAYGNSTSFEGSKIEVKFQGLCQGSCAAPAGWATISTTILKVHNKEGHGAHLVCPISNLKGYLAAMFFVDDTDNVHMDMCRDQSVEKAH